MYETFGFSKWSTGQYGFKLFIPDNTIDPTQYVAGGDSKIAQVAIVGDFQSIIMPGSPNWNVPAALPMTRTTTANGVLFSYALPPGFPDGFYQYKYVVTFNNRTVRWVCDPCTKYGGTGDDNSAFVLGGNPVEVTPLPPNRRLPSSDLIIYELMIDDFTNQYRGAAAPVDAVVRKLDDLVKLGINAIEFMPWIAWPDEDLFSWGYDPCYFFSVESAYVKDLASPLDKLSRLANLISECHSRNLHVILDVVLQHARDGSTDHGFPYYWLWQDPADSPFTNKDRSFGSLSLDYQNRCTQQFIGDVCKYWIDHFSVDGLRFDEVSGFLQGASILIPDLKAYLAAKPINNFPLIIEDKWSFTDISDTNTIDASNCWFDMFRSYPFAPFSGYVDTGGIKTSFMRVLNAAQDFQFPKGPVTYIENHDHSTVTQALGGRPQWFRSQPYMIALATCPGAIMIHNGQEFGQAELLYEDDSNVPAQFARVQSRPLLWAPEASDAIGLTLQQLYKKLFEIRRNHPGLRSPNFYPAYYDEQLNHFSPEGYGLDVDKQVIIYHRYGNNAAGQLERFIVVLNFSQSTQYVDIPFPTNGTWTDLLNGNATVQVNNYRLSNYPINSNWGYIFLQ